jgi:hypothetical protein
MTLHSPSTKQWKAENAAICNNVGTDFKVKSAQQKYTLWTLPDNKTVWSELSEPLLSHEIQELHET